MKTKIHNCHAHVFTTYDVPDRFLFLPLHIIAKANVFNLLVLLLRVLSWLCRSKKYERLANMIETGHEPHPRNVFKKIIDYYPDDAKFVLLSMDFKYMEAGKPKQGFRKQLEDLSIVKLENPESVFPFVAADPRRPNVPDVVKRHIEEKGFSGIKLYPPLGFYPFDERLYPVYEYAVKNNLPIISHCSPGGIFYKGKITSDMLIHPKTGKQLVYKNNDQFTDYYTDPANYEYVLKDFPELKICLAHFGGDIMWNNYLNSDDKYDYTQNWYYIIRNMISGGKFPNLYTDVAYTLSNPTFDSLLNITLLDAAVRQKVLFGSDFYMVRQEGSEYKFSLDLRNALGEENFKALAETNAINFLTNNRK